MSNCKATKFAIDVGGASGETDVADMWQGHFVKLYNSGSDDGAKELFLKKTTNTGMDSYVYFTALEIISAVHKQQVAQLSQWDALAGGRRDHASYIRETAALHA